MANTTIPQLPFLTAIGGAEQLEVVLAGSSYRITTGQIVLLAKGVPIAAVTKAQLVLALIDPTNPAGANVYTTMINAIDPTGGDAGSAEWLAGNYMFVGDPLYNLIEATMGWNTLQMLGFFLLAQTKPI